MEALFEQLKGYLNMDTEIAFDEFDTYYKEVLKHLDAEWQQLSEEDTMKMLFILDNLKSNAEDRAKRKSKEAKKYKKMFDRTSIWVQAMFKRLRDFGLSDEEIGQRYEALYEAV
ncbi:hypothetical protein [Brevibacillus dissolubilis]|uniref:hypothetical protein n=1 Tax=Brevibacillus dissolubilis TaxID=1844116 RepID=UPI00111722EC|nr:hypothetical protein [Brevibacillus dissolubilis]